MSTPVNSSADPEIFGPVEIALIAICKLSPETVDQICTQMRKHRQSFAETAIALDFATAEQIEKARGLASSSTASGTTNLVETALRKFTG